MLKFQDLKCCLKKKLAFLSTWNEHSYNVHISQMVTSSFEDRLREKSDAGVGQIQVVNHSKQQICLGASVQTSLNSPMMSHISYKSLDK